MTRPLDESEFPDIGKTSETPLGGNDAIRAKGHSNNGHADWAPNR